MGETYDARLEKPGWSQAGYDASAWSGVRVVDGSKDVLVDKLETLIPSA